MVILTPPARILCLFLYYLLVSNFELGIFPTFVMRLVLKTPDFGLHNLSVFYRRKEVVQRPSRQKTDYMLPALYTSVKPFWCLLPAISKRHYLPVMAINSHVATPAAHLSGSAPMLQPAMLTPPADMRISQVKLPSGLAGDSLLMQPFVIKPGG